MKMKGKSEFSSDVTATGDISHHFRILAFNMNNNDFYINFIY